MITKNELDRIKGTTVIRTKDEAIQQKKLLEEQKDQQLAQAKVSSWLLTLIGQKEENDGNGQRATEEDCAYWVPERQQV